MKKFLFILITLSLYSCSDDDVATPVAANTTSQNSLSTIMSGVKTDLAQAALFAEEDSSSKRASYFERAVNSNWTATTLTDPGGDDCETMTSPKTYLQEMSSDSCTISPFFDLNNILDMMCVITNELDVTDSLPDVLAEGDVTISSATATTCGVSDASGASITVEVEETSTSTYYQRLVTFSLDSNKPRTILIGSADDIDYIAFTYQEESDSAYRGFYSKDGDTVKFELQSNSASSSNATLFRILIEEGEISAVGTRNDDGSSYVRWSFKGPSDSSDDIGVDMVWAGQSSGNSIATCIDPSDSFSSDGTSGQGCGDDDFSAPSANSFSTLASSAVTTIMAESLATFVSNVGETDIVDFDDTDIQSASIID